MGSLFSNPDITVCKCWWPSPEVQNTTIKTFAASHSLILYFSLEMPAGPWHCLKLKASSVHPKPVFSSLPTVVSCPLQSNGPFDQGLKEDDGIKCHLLCNSQVHSNLSRGSPLHLRTFLTLKKCLPIIKLKFLFLLPTDSRSILWSSAEAALYTLPIRVTHTQNTAILPPGSTALLPKGSCIFKDNL